MKGKCRKALWTALAAILWVNVLGYRATTEAGEPEAKWFVIFETEAPSSTLARILWAARKVPKSSTVEVEHQFGETTSVAEQLSLPGHQNDTPFRRLFVEVDWPTFRSSRALATTREATLGGQPASADLTRKLAEALVYHFELDQEILQTKGQVRIVASPRSTETIPAIPTHEFPSQTPSSSSVTSSVSALQEREADYFDQRERARQIGPRAEATQARRDLATQDDEHRFDQFHARQEQLFARLSDETLLALNDNSHRLAEEVGRSRSFLEREDEKSQLLTHDADETVRAAEKARFKEMQERSREKQKMAMTIVASIFTGGAASIGMLGSEASPAAGAVVGSSSGTSAGGVASVPQAIKAPIPAQRAPAGKPNGGRAEAIFGEAGAIFFGAIGAGLGGMKGGNAGSGALNVAGADGGRALGEAAGRAIDRHAEKLKKEYDPKSDPRFDPRSLFDN